MRRVILIIVTTFSLLSLLTSCFYKAEPVVRLNPSTIHDTTWVQGVEVALSEDNDLSALLGFGSSGDRILMLCEITNTGYETITVNPADFSCRYIAQGKKPMSLLCSAYDPRTEINRIDIAIEEEIAEGKNITTANAIGGTLDFVGTVVDIFSKSKTEEDKKAKEERSEDRDNRSEDRKEAIEAHEKRLEALRYHKAALIENLLQITTLAPGDTVSGYVAFRKITEAQQLEFHISCGASDVVFYFDQSLMYR